MFVNNTFSDSGDILCGVPQGSILGPLLFLIFINDFPLHIDNVLTDLYADDTTLYCTGRSQACIEQQLQAALHKLSNWCKQNGMLINTAKTKVMLLTTPQKRIHLNENTLKLTLNNEILTVVTSDKILGVHIDNNLTWTDHINAVAKKKWFKIYGCSLESRNTYPLIREFSFTRPTFNPILIIAIQSGEVHHKEI